MGSEVEVRQRLRLEEITKQNEKAKKSLASDKEKLQKDKDAVVKELDKLRETNGTLTKKNCDLAAKLITKDALIEGIKAMYGVDDSTDTEENEINVVQEDISHKCNECNKSYKTNNHLKSHIEEKHTNKCNACNKIFKTSKDLENHIEAKHEEKSCTYCDEICTGERELANHMQVCIDIGVANKTCDKCNQIFTGQGLKRHIKTCKGKTFDCPECGELCSSPNNVKKHQEKEHEWETVRSREVCKHWRRGNCWKGTSCLFSHVGQQQGNSSETT